MPEAITQNKNKVKLLPETMSGSMAWLQPGSAPNSVAQITARAHTEARIKACGLQGPPPRHSMGYKDIDCLQYHLGPRGHAGPGLPLRAMSRSIALKQPWSRLTYMAQVTIEHHEEVWGQTSHLSLG